MEEYKMKEYKMNEIIDMIRTNKFIESIKIKKQIKDFFIKNAKLLIDNEYHVTLVDNKKVITYYLKQNKYTVASVGEFNTYEYRESELGELLYNDIFVNNMDIIGIGDLSKIKIRLIDPLNEEVVDLIAEEQLNRVEIQVGGSDEVNKIYF